MSGGISTAIIRRRKKIFNTLPIFILTVIQTKPDTGWWTNEYNRLDRVHCKGGDRSTGGANYFIVFVKKTYTHAGNELYYGYG
jgi:hypothetical protein